MVRSILDGVNLGGAHWAEVHDPTIIKGDHGLEQEVCVAAGYMLVKMHVTDWAKAQREDPVLSAVVDWLEAQKDGLKDTFSRACLKSGGLTDLAELTELHDSPESLYLGSMPKGENDNLLLFTVPKAHWVATLNECHRDAGHQGHDHTLSLLLECFWWLGMTNQMWQSIKTCMHCLQHEGSLPRLLYTLLWPLLPWISYK